MDKKELVKFSKLSTSGYGSRNFLKGFFNIAMKLGHFSNLAHISGKPGRIFITIFIRDVTLDKENLLHLGSRPDLEF